MKSNEAKLEFIKLRAKNKSYSYISKALNISKSTCTEWEKQLKDAIAELKREELQELYTSYHMTKEARIKQLGETLGKIDEAITNLDFNLVPPEKLLDYKLKYIEALKEEHIPLKEAFNLNGDSLEAKDILAALTDLLERIREGEITTEQANKEATVINNLLKAYDVVEIKAKLDAIEAALGGA